MNINTDFTGEGLSFSVAGAGVSVDPARGELRIPTAAFRDGVELIVTATESGVTSRYRIGVVAEPAPAAPEDPGTVEPKSATVAARDPAEPVGLAAPGRRRRKAPAGLPDFPASQIALAKSSAVVTTTTPTAAPAAPPTASRRRCSAIRRGAATPPATPGWWSRSGRPSAPPTA